tara:strand:+ start:110 stop:592 length:483 start_codon:yes stop_codon:yes gene_type:complete
MFFQNWILDLFFGLLFIAGFIWVVFRNSKEMGWNELSERYSFSREQLKKLKVKFDYGQSYFNDVYYNGIHVASIDRGLLLRHPFPFNYSQSALLIPWNDIVSIKIKRGLRRENGRKNIIPTVSLKKYAYIELSSVGVKIIIPWKANVKKHSPQDLIEVQL